MLHAARVRYSEPRGLPTTTFFALNHMATSADQHEFIEPEHESRWNSLFSWTTFLLIGWLIWEITSQAFLSVAILCCKIGWEDVRTSFWLRKIDRDRPRAKMEFWIFLAAGMWKAAISGFALMFVLAATIGKPGGQVPQEFMEAGVTAFVGFPLSSLATIRALALAIWYRRKIWQSGGVHAYRRKGQWPPLASGDVNKARVLIITSFIVLIVPSIIFILFSLFADQPRADISPILVCGVLLGSLIGGSLAFAAGCDYLERQVLAASPQECWGQDWPGVQAR